MANRDVGVVFDPVFVAALNHKERIGQDVDVVTARIDYRFGGPVTARY
jgi:outer membrane immunogenic protein